LSFKTIGQQIFGAAWGGNFPFPLKRPIAYSLSIQVATACCYHTNGD